MTPLPLTAQDDADDFRWLTEPVLSLPEELERSPIAQGCPDATAWDEDEARIILPARMLAYVREKIGHRYLTSEAHAEAVAVLAIYQSRNNHEIPDPLSETALERARHAARQVYHEQRAEYLLDWSPTIPDSERAA